MDGQIRIMKGIILSCVGFFSLVGMVVPSGGELYCGDTIGPDEVATLTHDLTCPGVGEAALSIESGSLLNMNGFTVDCVERGRDGIQVKGSAAILQNGTVTNCRLGVEVTGDGRHIVTKVTARGNRFWGFAILSNDNKLSYNTSADTTEGLGFQLLFLGNRNTLKGNLARENNGDGFFAHSKNDNSFIKNRAISNIGKGFSISGNRNDFRKNLAKDNGNGSFDAGFNLEGNNVKVLWNKSVRNSGAGFLIQFGSSRVTVLGNIAKKNKEQGIRVSQGAIDNTLKGNVAVRNKGNDLSDGNPHCDNNKWKWNWFKTGNKNCIQ